MTRLLALLLTAVTVAPAVEPDLLPLHGTRARTGLPTDWQLRTVRGRSAPAFSIHLDAPEGPRLRVEGRGQAAWAVRKLAMPISEETGRLHWSWRVLAQPANADLRLPERDDSPLRLIVVFGKPPGPLGGSGRILFYTWGNAEPEGFEARSAVSGKMHVIRAGGSSGLGEAWLDVAVSPFEDFRRLWKGTPPPITAIGVMQDTDATGERAIAELRSVRWLTPAASEAVVVEEDS